MTDTTQEPAPPGVRLDPGPSRPARSQPQHRGRRLAIVVAIVVAVAGGAGVIAATGASGDGAPAEPAPVNAEHTGDWKDSDVPQRGEPTQGDTGDWKDSYVPQRGAATRGDTGDWKDSVGAR